MKPILFNTEMVRAILDGRKTCTRRVIKPHYRDDEAGFQVITNANTGEFVRVEKIDENECSIFADGTERCVPQPAYTGDILWVRETFGYDAYAAFNHHTYYLADGENRAVCGWHPSIHMPKDAARIFLRVTSVRAERLQSLTNDAVEKEGVSPRGKGSCKCIACSEGCQTEPCANRDAYERECYVLPFARLWDSTIKGADIGKYGWVANPWVWVIEFERISREARTK